MKYIFLFIAISFCSANTSAQYYNTHRPDTLRWFIGKWTDSRTFKIDSTVHGRGGGGGTITRKANGTLDISTPGNKDLEKRMNDGIKAIEDDEKDISNTIKLDEAIYQFNLADKSIKELEKLKAEFKEMAGNTPSAPSSPPTPPNGVASELARNCAAIAPEYHRIVDFYKAHRGERHPHFDLPIPPVADYFNCWSCDTAKQIAFDTASAIYVRDFFKDIRKDINQLLGLMRQMEALGVAGSSSLRGDVDDATRDAFDSTRSHQGACSFISYTDMSLALEFYFNRGMQMVKQLWKDNQNNYGALVPVIKICLAAYQQQQAFGAISDAEANDETINMAIPMEHLYDSMTTLLCKNRDYKLIGNIPFMIGLYQNIFAFTGGAMLNGEIVFGTSYRPKYTAKDLLAFPHFELTLDLETKVGENGSYHITHLKSKSKVIAELDDKECVKFTLSKKEQDKITADLVANEAISPYPHPVYVGTHTYTSHSPIFKLRFCPIEGAPTGDSIYLSSFSPLAPDKGNWAFQGKMIPAAIYQADRLFLDINEMKNDAQAIDPEDNQKQLEDIKKNSLEMAAKIKAMQAAGKVDPMKMGEMVKQMMNNTSSVVESKTSEIMRIRLPLKVTNMDKVLINQRFDAKAINPQISQPIVYAYLTIKLLHTPTNGSGEDD